MDFRKTHVVHTQLIPLVVLLRVGRRERSKIDITLFLYWEGGGGGGGEEGEEIKGSVNSVRGVR